MQKVGVLPTFEYLGIGYLIVAVVAGSFMQNPPPGWKPAGWTPSASRQISERSDPGLLPLGEARLKTWQWWALCSLMSLQHHGGPIHHVSGSADNFPGDGALERHRRPAGLVGVVSIGNGVGRVFWAWVSDLTTRKTAFFLMFLIQAVLFWTYHSISSVLLLGIVTFIITSCATAGHARNHASFCSGLFRAPGRRTDFRFDAVSLGICSRLWSVAVCILAPGHRRLRPSAPPHCRYAHPSHSFYRFSSLRLAAGSLPRDPGPPLGSNWSLPIRIRANTSRTRTGAGERFCASSLWSRRAGQNGTKMNQTALARERCNTCYRDRICSISRSHVSVESCS